VDEEWVRQIEVEQIERMDKSFILPKFLGRETDQLFRSMYNGVAPWTAKRSFRETLEGYGRFGRGLLDFQYILLDVNRYTEQELFGKENLMSVSFRCSIHGWAVLSPDGCR
jgi:hypothetical protein